MINAKKAKTLRLLVRQLLKNEVIKGPWTRYGQVKQADKLVPNKDASVDVEGGAMPEPFKAIPRFCRVVDPMSPRGVYLRMKKAGPQAVLSGKA